MARYSNLKPFTIEEKIYFSKIICNFFSPLENIEIRKKLSLPFEENKTVPLSISDLLKFLSTIDKDIDKIQFSIRKLVMELEFNNILCYEGQYGKPPIFNRCYYFFKEFTNNEKNSDLWLSEALGFDFIVYKYSKYIIQLTGKDKYGDISSGSGILCLPNIILTCGHNISDMELDEYQNISGNKVKIIDKKYHDIVDIGLVYLEKEFEIEKGLAFNKTEILDKIILFGYPKIPQSISSELVIQTGEINSFFIDYKLKNKYFLFSSISRPGDSGGPIFSKKGHIVGIVSRHFREQSRNCTDLFKDFIKNFDGCKINEDFIKTLEFEKDNYNLPFFAGVPTDEIIKAINDIDSKIVLPFEEYS